MLKNLRHVAALLLAGVLALTACGEKPPRDTLTLSLPGIPTSLDPLQAGQQDAGFLVQNIFETLYRYRYLERPYALTPELAAQMPQVSDDGLSVTIRVAPGHRFADHDAFPGGRGREVTAADVAYSLRRHFLPDTPSAGAWLWRDVVAPATEDEPCRPFCVIADDLLVIHLKTPYPQLAATLATPFAAIVPREVVEYLGDDFSRQPLGSGPYRLTRFDETGATLEANPNYHRPALKLVDEGWKEPVHGPVPWTAPLTLPLSPHLEIAFVPDEGARFLAFHAGGDLDLIRLPAGQVETLTRAPLQGDPGSVRLKHEFARQYALNLAPELGFVRLEFNLLDPQLGQHDDPQLAERNRRLRCAVIGADRWQHRNEALFAGLGQVFRGIVPPAAGTSAQEWSIPGYPLADHQPVLRYGAVRGPRAQQEFAVFRTRQIAAGYPENRIELRTYARLSDLVNGIHRGEVNVYLTGWAMDYPDPLNNYQLFYGPNRYPGANFSGFDDARFNQAYEAAVAMPPGPLRAPHYEVMNTRLTHECVTSSGLARQSVFVRRAQVVAFADNGPVNGVMARFAAAVSDR